MHKIAYNCIQLHIDICEKLYNNGYRPTTLFLLVNGYLTVVINQKVKIKMQNYNSKFKSDLKQRSFDFSLEIIKACETLPNKRSAWIIADRLIRASTSIGANLVEARASSSRLEFKKFHEIALKSANEARYWLELLQETELAHKDGIKPLIEEVTELANMLAKSVMSLKNKIFWFFTLNFDFCFLNFELNF